MRVAAVAERRPHRMQAAAVLVAAVTVALARRDRTEPLTVEAGAAEAEISTTAETAAPAS
jgi:hypothetical protein